MASQNIPSVSHENLKQIFTGREFLKGINKATKIGLERHTESHFSIWRKVSSDKFKCFSPIQTSYDLPTATGFELSENQYARIDKEKLVPIVTYHCHPGPYVSPSEADLSSHFEIRGQHNLIYQGNDFPKQVDNYHLDCVGAIREGGQIHDVLIFQNRSRQIDIQEGAFVYDQLLDKLGNRKGSNQLVAEVIDSLGYWNGHLLTYKKVDDKYQINGDQLNGLEKFAYTPAINTEF